MMIRLATYDDRDALVALGLEFIASSSYATFQSGAEQVGEMFDLTIRNGEVFVSEVDGRLVGMLAIVLVPHLLSGQIYADEVAWFVQPGHRNGTVGPRLFRTMETWALQNRANLIKMVAPVGSDVGRFYHRLGYRPVETAYVKVLTYGVDDGHCARRAGGECLRPVCREESGEEVR